MPYKIYKVVGGYKVGLLDGGKMSNVKRFLSNKILSEKQKEKKNVSKSNGTVRRRRKVEKKQTPLPTKKKY